MDIDLVDRPGRENQPRRPPVRIDVTKYREFLGLWNINAMIAAATTSDEGKRSRGSDRAAWRRSRGPVRSKDNCPCGWKASCHGMSYQ